MGLDLAPIKKRLSEAQELADSFAMQLSTCFHHVPFLEACEECGRPKDPYVDDVSVLLKEIVKLQGIVQTFHWLDSDYTWGHLWKNAQWELAR